MVTVHDDCAGNVAVPVVRTNVALAAPVSELVAEKDAVPQPTVCTGASVEANTKSGRTNSMESPISSGAFDTKLKVTEVGAAVTGFPSTKALAAKMETPTTNVLEYPVITLPVTFEVALTT